jgi:hypothetical protein
MTTPIAPSLRTTTHAVVAAILASASIVSAASAQTLGDVARQEQSRRKAIASTAKVYTNDNLPAVEPSPAPVAGARVEAAPPQAGAAQTAPAPPATGASGAKPPAEETKKDEAYWRERLKTEREALARAESFAEALQSRINALSNDFVNRDDPAQRNVIAGDRQKALAELDRVKTEIRDHKQALDDIQQEGRREGVPAGWLR